MIKAVDAVTFFPRTPPPAVIPSDADAPGWETLVRRVNTIDQSRYPLDEVKAILRRENERIGADSSTLGAVDSIGSGTVFVAAGQQAGLFGGPLYTLYKALHAVCLSSRLSDATGRRVLPLFWIASDDHDFEEVRSIGLRTPDGSVLRAEYTPSPYREGMPVGEITIDEGIESAISLLAGTLPPGDRADRYLEIIRSSWRPGVLWSDAFAAQMARMCASSGLILVDPRWKGVKELFGNIMAAEIDNPRVSASLVNEEAGKIESSRNRRKALRKPEGSTNLFMELEGIRHPLFHDGTNFRAGERIFSTAELHEILKSAPGRFSPGAALRPVCQDAVFPVAALIGGPGERRYLEQTAPLYEFFGVDGSIVWPRASFTLVDRRVERISQKEGIPLALLFEDIDRIRSEYASERFPEKIQKRFDDLDRSIAEGFSGLGQSLGVLDRTLIESVEKEKGKVLHILDGLRERALRAHKASAAVSEKRFAAAVYALQPGGKSQERWFGSDAAFMMLGEDGICELMNLTSPGEEHHRLVFPEDSGDS
ncbi:bacillithiol biosynthesis cysteine-adding enzyme BshC [bacterium]|nr:bacillithiol biosynthesis cysteine-adding enzyme BshC [bacterium]